LTDGEGETLTVIGKQLGRKALDEVANIVGPDAILAWHRGLVAKKFDGSKKRTYPGRPSIDAELEELEELARVVGELRRGGKDAKCAPDSA